ncbi:hypothetical protein LF65_00093 [Clostridium beijerinckii]|uniref:Uncharacterized protein n=1 Tax=Clostridium beijerinckii TaxID=1520 RepID=A0A0B5Q3N9_CLOBE|nr:hypothetical protein [Clostridium beijerinckii]AJG96784.1 hypothetical protein LF65_00093 [Clostridium beijerinckii]
MSDKEFINMMLKIMDKKEKNISPLDRVLYGAGQLSYKKYRKFFICKIIRKKIRDTRELAKHIYSEMVKPNNKKNIHDQEFVEYINRRIILYMYNKEEREKKIYNKYKDIYKQYEEHQKDKKNIPQAYRRFFKKFSIFDCIKINENIANFIFLSYHSLAKGFSGNKFESIVTFEYDKYTINDLMKFYCRLNNFIIENKEKNNYMKIAYENLENIFYGYRFKLIINDLKNIMESEEKKDIIISLMRIKDINLSIKLIEEFLKNINDVKKLKNIFNDYTKYYYLYNIIDDIVIIVFDIIKEIKIIEMQEYNECDCYILNNISYNEICPSADKLYKKVIDELDELDWEE